MTKSSFWKNQNTEWARQTALRNILVFQMGNWMLKANKRKIQFGFKASPSSCLFDVKKLHSALHATSVLQDCMYKSKRSHASLCSSPEGQVMDGSSKQKNDFSTKKKSVMKTTTDRQRSCQSVPAKGSKERTKRQQLWKKYSLETQLINIVSACRNKKEKNIKGKRGKKQFGTCLFQINLYRIHPSLSQATVLCWSQGAKYWSLWEHLNCFWSLYRRAWQFWHQSYHHSLTPMLTWPTLPQQTARLCYSISN